MIVNGLQFDKRADEFLTDGLIRALELTGKDGITKLLALADSGSDKDLARVVEIYIPPCVPALAAGEEFRCCSRIITSSRSRRSC